jgi:ATP-binding cassette, subfamily B, bacterial PglK
MSPIKKNIFYKTISKLNGVLLPQHKKKAILIFSMVFISGILEVFGLAIVLPVISVALDSSLIHSNFYLQFIYNGLNFGSDQTFLFVLLAVLVAVFIGKNIFSVLIAFGQSNYSYRISTDIARSQFKRYYQKDLQFFTDNNSNNLYQNIRAASSWLSTFVLLPLISFFSELVVVAVVIIGMAIYDIKIFTMVSVTLVPVFLLIYRFVKNKIQLLEESKAAIDVDSNKTLFHTLHGYVDIKLFNKDNYFINKYLGFEEKLNNTHSKIVVLQSLPAKIIEIAAVMGVMVIIVYSKLAEGADRSLVPLLSLYIVAAYRLMPSMNRMLLAMMKIKSYQFLFEILKSDNDDRYDENIQTPAKLNFSNVITFESINFTYPGANHLTLNNISLVINKGERIGFVGQSGAGKTTLINILLRFLQENSGKIMIDNTVKLESGNINSWRNLIGYVQQNVYIFDGDFYENIALGIDRAEINDEKMKKAIKSSKLEELVMKLPLGLSTNIGENGTKLSGGQRQRIAIARALYKDAEILIFDEATSSLDQETEKEITEAIDALSSENKTMLIIAHRISTLKNCDRIIELEHGVIKKEYSYRELVGLN